MEEPMLVAFRTTKLQKQYEQSDRAVRAYGHDVARKYIQRINIIKLARTFEELKSLHGFNCHPLKGDLKGKWSISLTGFYRLIITREGGALEIVKIEEVSKHYDD